MVFLSYLFLTAFCTNLQLIQCKSPSPNLIRSLSLKSASKEKANQANSLRKLVSSSSDSSTCSGEMVSIEIKTDPFPRESSWNITDINNNNKSVLSEGPYISANKIHVSDHCLYGGDFRFIISDTQGDGLCCYYGKGYYKLSVGGKLIKEGGAFGSKEVIDFSVTGTRPTPKPTNSPTSDRTPYPSFKPSFAPSIKSSSSPSSSEPTPSPTLDQTTSPSFENCAPENKRAIECGASGGADKCCTGLVCHDYQHWRCVKKEFRKCSGPNTYATECGSDWPEAAPKCCPGLQCSDKKCVQMQ